MNIIQIFRMGIGILFPEDCPACGIRPLMHPLLICDVCKKRILSENMPSAISSQCLNEIWSCLRYEDISSECIKQFKYCGKRNMIRVFDEIIQQYVIKNQWPVEKADMIIPVPIHRNRFRKRGFNQSLLLAEAVSKHISVPVLADCLVKTKNTPPQTGLSKNARGENLKNSFLASHTSRITGKTLLLVDDVMTTGTTLETCAKELLKAGAKQVSAFTLARTV